MHHLDEVPLPSGKLGKLPPLQILIPSVLGYGFSGITQIVSNFILLITFGSKFVYSQIKQNHVHSTGFGKSLSFKASDLIKNEQQMIVQKSKANVPSQNHSGNIHMLVLVTQSPVLFENIWQFPRGEGVLLNL